MKETNGCLYDFGAFRVDPSKRRLSREGQTLPLTSKAFETLLMLVRRQGETVTKDELMAAIWFDTTVEENNLTQQISTLRKTLGEKARSPRFIITIPGQGYSFIAPVVQIPYPAPVVELPCETANEGGLGETHNPERRAVGRFNFRQYFFRYRLQLATVFFGLAVFSASFFYSYLNSKSSICVLPFKSLDNTEKSNLYSAGIPSYVTAKIGSLPNMTVRPVDTSGQYYGQYQDVITVGREHNVDTVLTGYTQSQGDVVQVVVHLWDVKNSRQIWAKVITKSAADTLGTQDAISEEIIYALRSEL